MNIQVYIGSKKVKILMDITKDHILKLVSTAHDMAGLDDILEDEDSEDTDEGDSDISVDFDEGIVSDLNIDEALPLIDNDALFNLIAKAVDKNASGDGEYAIENDEISFFFQLIETNKDDSCRIIPISKTCKAQWTDFIDMMNSIVHNIRTQKQDSSSPSTHFELSFKHKEN
jgi:hypothetical protein